jgi:nucleotide-binding universal stress UspA family protein
MFEKILVPLDGSPASETVLPYVIDLAKRYGAPVELLIISLIPTLYHAIDPVVLKLDLDSCAAYIAKPAARLKEAGVTVTTHVAEGAPAVARAIVKRAEAIGAGLIVMSTHGQGSIERLVLGSVSERVAHLAHVPVMLVRPPGH